MRIEWSKGWGYTEAGAWTSDDVIEQKVPVSLTAGRPTDAGWSEAVERLRALDPHAIFVNPFLARLMPTTSEECPADVDADGLVGGRDLSVLLSAWGASDGAADLNGDGLVDGSDLSRLLSDWGPCRP